MRPALCFLAVLAALTIGAGRSEAETSYSPPTEIRYKNGTVLRNVVAERWEKDRVIVRYNGQLAPVMFHHIASPSTDEIKLWRTHGDLVKQEARIADIRAKEKSMRTISGQVYVVTRGRENYKLGDLNVYFVPEQEMAQFLETNSISTEYERYKSTWWSGDPNLRPVDNRADRVVFLHFEKAPRGVHTGRTDAEGRYEALVPRGQSFYVMARDTRRVYSNTEFYVFLKLIGPNETVVNLSNGNLWNPEKE